MPSSVLKIAATMATLSLAVAAVTIPASSAPTVSAATPTSTTSVFMPYVPGPVTTSTPSGGGPCTAVLTASPANSDVQPPCGFTTWTSTTTTSYAVDCQGCKSVNAIFAARPCPMGATHITPSTAAGAFTIWEFVCSATPKA